MNINIASKVKYLVLIILSVISAPLIAASESRTLKIGYLLDLSAKGAFMGQQSQAGAMLAEKELSSADVKLKIIYEDHRTDAKTAVTAVKKLLNIDQVDAVICDLTPTCTAISPLVADAKKILLYQAPAVSILNLNHYAFKNFLDYKQGCRRIAEYWKDSGVKRVVHFKVNAEFGELCLQGAKEIFPNQEVFDYDSNDDLRSITLKAKDFKAQAILQTGYEADYINRIKASSDIDFNVPTGMPEPLLTQTLINSVSAKALNGTIPLLNLGSQKE